MYFVLLGSVTYTYIYIYISFFFIYLSIFMHRHVYVCMYVYIYTHIYIYTRTYMIWHLAFLAPHGMVLNGGPVPKDANNHQHGGYLTGAICVTVVIFGT